MLRSETVLDFMANLRQQHGPQRFPDICTKELVGLIVLTKYDPCLTNLNSCNPNAAHDNLNCLMLISVMLTS